MTTVPKTFGELKAQMHRLFEQSGGPLSLEELTRAFSSIEPSDVAIALKELREEKVVRVFVPEFYGATNRMQWVIRGRLGDEVPKATGSN